MLSFFEQPPYEQSCYQRTEYDSDDHPQGLTVINLIDISTDEK